MITGLADFWKSLRKLYAAGILVYFAAAGVNTLSIPDFSDWLFFMSRDAIYALAWPIMAAAERPGRARDLGAVPANNGEPA